MTSSVIGIDIQTGQRVEVPQASRRQGTYIIGANGTGKTGLIENLIIQDIQQGLGVCLLDPHGDLTLAVLSRLPDTREKDVIYLDIADEDYPFGVNLFACDDLGSIKAVQYVVDQVMHIFDKLFDVDRSTPLLAEYLRNCTHTLVVNPGFTMADIPLLLLDEHCRRRLVTQVTDPDVRLFWRGYDQMKASEQREEAASTLRRVREFLQPLSRNIVGQSKTTIDLSSVMDERKILLVKLDARLPSVTSLIGSVLIALFLNAAYSRADTEIKKRKQFNIYADEFQRFATEDFATLLTEARKFGIAPTIAHQMRDQLDPHNKGATLNVANVVVFKISGKDAEEVAGEFDSTPPPPEVIGQRPILSPKRDVVDHLVKTGHSNPGYLEGTKLLSGLLQVSGVRIDSPQYEGMLGGGLEDLLANMMIGSKNKAAQNQYLQATQLITELKTVIQRLNNLFYEVMRDRDANKPLDQKDFIILLKVTDLYAFVSRFPNIIGSLCMTSSPRNQAVYAIACPSKQPVEADFPSLPFSSRPQALLVEHCSFHLKLASFRTGFLAHQVHITLKGHDLLTQPLDRHLLDLLATQVDAKGTVLRVHKQHDVLARKLLLDVVGLQIDLYAAMSIDLAGEGLPVYGRQPAVGIDLLGRATAALARQDGRHEGVYCCMSAPGAVSPGCNAA
jgi:hypothetical protein